MLTALLNKKERDVKKFWEELIAHFPLMRYRAHRNRRLQQIFVGVGTSLSSCYVVTTGIHRQTHRHTNQTILLLLRAFFAAGIYLLSRCLARKGGIHFTEPLPSSGRGIYIQTDWWKGFVKYVVEMGSSTMIYMPSFIKTGSGIQKLISGIHRHTDLQRAWTFHKSTLGK
jgi:hypothetical protein